MFVQVTNALLEGFWESLKVFGLTLLFSIPLGLVICFGSMSKWAPLDFLSKSKDSFFEKFKPIQWICKGLVWVVRGTPLMLQLIVIFYGPGLKTSSAKRRNRSTVMLGIFLSATACMSA